MKYIVSIILVSSILISNDINGAFTISRIKYSGGGDWYADKTSLTNLLKFVSFNTNISTDFKEKVVEIGDNNFLKNSYFYLTGHGNIKLTEKEKNILREHLINGAFLHVDDNYGLDKSFRKLVTEIFPDKDLVEIPKDHQLFNCYYKFSNGLPKIHEHDNQRPQALGIFHEKKLILLYTYESDLGDGWEDAKVHNNSENLREQALKMGTNIIIFSLIQ
ncbi:MAG: hypothetical protein CMG64_00735 [Candidatus Marinimicrobia bacterium]|nr:hypothetical protein [Candidatus Neomarinimicrobiota bacterium]|tara:strand:+ start:2370 stop:3023 length:654 start_codon:yes stop_codon:yes gene_type:complete